MPPTAAADSSKALRFIVVSRLPGPLLIAVSSLPVARDTIHACLVEARPFRLEGGSLTVAIVTTKTKPRSGRRLSRLGWK